MDISFPGSARNTADAGNDMSIIEADDQFHYGHIVPWVRQKHGGLEAIAGPDALILRTPIATRGEDLTTVAEFNVAKGDWIPFVLTWFASHKAPPRAIHPKHALQQTENFWTSWSKQCCDESSWRE